MSVSIRRADRCLVEGAHAGVCGSNKSEFQSAVRIAVWLKARAADRPRDLDQVSIRRADRCLVEGLNFVQLLISYQFQSAVRIAVWLKVGRAQTHREIVGFNPPCGSLFG